MRLFAPHLKVNVYFDPPQAAASRRDYEYETVSVMFHRAMETHRGVVEKEYRKVVEESDEEEEYEEVNEWMESEEESEEDIVGRKREQRDEDGRPVYKLGITLGQKRDKDGETIVIIDEVTDESTAYGLVKPNRVLVMVNKEMCTCVEEAQQLINKAKRSPNQPLELTLRTQTKRVDESGAKAKKAKKAKVTRRQDASDLRDCDLLILSPRQLAPSNFLRAQLENMEFHRLIVDESHLVGKVHQGEELKLEYLLQVRAAHIWLLTGTPYSASLAELHAQCRLLGRDAWLTALQQSVSNEAAADMLRELMIRHTKAQRIHGQVALALPRAAFKVVQLELSSDEMKLYQQHLCMSSTTLPAGAASNALPGVASNALPPPKPYGNVRLRLKVLAHALWLRMKVLAMTG